MNEIVELQTQLQAFKSEVEGLKSSLLQSGAQKNNSGPVEAPSSEAGEIATASFTPMTPKAPVLHTTTLALQPISLPAMTTSTPRSVWKHMIIFEDLFGQSAPVMTMSLLTYGTVAFAILVLTVRPGVFRNATSGMPQTARAGFLGLWKR